MKKFALAFALVAALLASFSGVSAQTVASGRTIVYPLENPPSGDTTLQPARFERLNLGSFMADAFQLTASGSGLYANCTTAPSTGLFVTISPTVSGGLCSLYQLTADDANAIPVGYSPQLAADPTLIVVHAMQNGATANIGPLSPPASNSVYWLIEAQISTTDTNSQSRYFFNPGSGQVTPQTVNTTRQDAIVYQTKEGTPGASPSKPSVDAGWIAVAYALVPSGTVTLTSGMLSAGSAFAGFGGQGVTLFPTPAPTSTPYLTQNGYLATQGALFDCNGSLPHFLACPQAIVVGNGAGFAGVCSGYASWGTNLTNAVAGVIGEVAALGCDGPTTPQMTLDSHGDIGVGKGVYSDFYNVYNGSNRIINWLQASSDGAGACGITAASGGGLKYVASSGTCRWIFLNGPLAHSAVGLDANNAVISASTDTELSGAVTCAVSSATSCTTAAVTVRSGAHCLATMDASSTVAGPYHAPVVNNASGSLTVVLTAVTAGTGNLAANYWCP